MGVIYTIDVGNYVIAICATVIASTYYAINEHLIFMLVIAYLLFMVPIFINEAMVM